MKSSKGIIILIVTILVVASVVLLGYAYLKTDIFKTPEQRFIKYLYSNVEQLMNFKLTPFDEFAERSATEASKNEITFKQKTEGEGMIAGTDSVLKITTMTDPVAKKQQINLNATTSNVDIFDMEMLMTDTRLGIKIPDLYEKYLALDTTGLKDFSKNVGADEEFVNTIPDTINLFPNTAKLSEEDKKLSQELLLKYANRFFELVDDEIYVEEEKVNLYVEDQEYIANKYSLPLSVSQLNTIYTTISTEIIADPEVTSLCAKVAPELDFTKLKVSNEEFIKNLSELDQTATLTISLYESDGLTRKTEFISDSGAFTFYFVNTDLNSKAVMIFDEYKNGEVEVASSQIVTIINEVQNQVSNLSMESSLIYDKSDINALIKKENQNNNSFYDEEYYNQVYQNSTSKVALRTVKADNNTLKSTLTMSGDSAESAEGSSINIVTKLNETLKFNNFNDENTTVINNYTPLEYGVLGMELLANAAKTAEEKPESLVASVYSLFSLFGLIDVPEEPVTHEGQDEVQDEVVKAIENILLAYRFAIKSSPEENIGDYLTIDNLQSKVSEDITIEFYDGQTLKCTRNGDVFYVTFIINGNDFTLESTEIRYSADGTYESAMNLQTDDSEEDTTFDYSFDTFNTFDSSSETTDDTTTSLFSGF